MKDRVRIKNLSGMGQLILDIKPQRCDSDVFVNHKIDVTNLMEYLAKRKEAGDSVTFFHAFITAAGKTLYNRRKLNYFVANRHLYDHTTVSLSFVAKIEFEDSSEEIMLIIPIEPEDTIDTISKKVADKVAGVRNKTESKAGANSALDVLGKLPNIIRVPLVGLFKWMDNKGILPSSLSQDNLYYSSMILSNLGPLHFESIYHNITNFGTCSSIITIGEIKDEEVVIDGVKQTRKMCEIGANFDERVADGFYFIKSVKFLEKIMSDPTYLEKPVGEIVESPKVNNREK